MRCSKALFTAVIATTLITSGCSNESANTATEASADAVGVSADQSASRSDDAPGFNSTAAPGIAFAYRYAFLLPGEAISDVQAEHAAACEKLGRARCRITGMKYDKGRGDSIQAQMDLMLAPDIAHSFGKQALDQVKKASGRLRDVNVTGENAGDEIAMSQQSSAALEAELTRIEARLVAKGLSGTERRSLVEQAASIREQLRGEVIRRQDKEKAIASTPMHFSYASEGLFSASDSGLSKAASTSWASMTTMFSFLLTVLALAAPWALPAGLVWLAWRCLRAKLGRPAVEL